MLSEVEASKITGCAVSNLAGILCNLAAGQISSIITDFCVCSFRLRLKLKA